MEGHQGHNDSSTVPNVTERSEIDITTSKGIERVKAIFEAQDISPQEPPDKNLESIWLSGNLDTFLATGEDTNGQYALFDLYVPPGAGPLVHFHNREDEVYRILDGEVTFQEDNRFMTVGTPGDLVFLPRGHLHGFQNLGREPARVQLFATPAGFENFFRAAGEPGTDPSNPVPEDPEKLVAAANTFGIEPYPEAELLGQEIPEDGGITIVGDETSETLIGKSGSDIIVGRNGRDQFNGHRGNDILIGGTGYDQFDGGRGNDLISSRQANDTLTGGGDRDTFIFIAPLGTNTDTITDFGGVGSGANPSVTATAEVDTLGFTGDGLVARNMLLTQDENDLLITFMGDEETEVILENFTLDNLDNLQKSSGAPLDIGNILFDGQSDIQDSFDVADADQNLGRVFNQNTVTFLNDLDNTTRGFNTNDVINGQGGNDKLEGLSGDDLLRGSIGNDILIGGAGKDIVDGGKGSDLFVLKPGAGTDTIADFTHGQDLIELSGSLKFADLAIAQGTGTNANNTLISTTGRDELLAILTGLQASSIINADFSFV